MPDAMSRISTFASLTGLLSWVVMLPEIELVPMVGTESPGLAFEGPARGIRELPDGFACAQAVPANAKTARAVVVTNTRGNIYSYLQQQNKPVRVNVPGHQLYVQARRGSFAHATWLR